MTDLIAERLSARQLIQLRISFCVCMSVTLRNANFTHTAHAQFGFPYSMGLAHAPGRPALLFDEFQWDQRRRLATLRRDKDRRTLTMTENV